MLIAEISWEQVLRAGTVIFGPSFAVEIEADAWRNDLRSVYRRRVLETHPDRAVLLGRTEPELVREFRAVNEAYELLAQLRAGPLPERPAPRPRAAAPRRPTPRPAERRAAPPPPGPAAWQAAWNARQAAPAAGRATGHASSRPPPRAAPRPAAPPGPARAASAWSAPGGGIDWGSTVMPRRRLRIAEFLYYSRRIGWQDFVGAVAWQRAQRPPVGRIAVDFGFLRPVDVAEILELRRREAAAAILFGEFAVRHGYVTPFQLLAMLGQQLRLQRPIGEYFIDRGLVSDGELDQARVGVFRHNARTAA